MEVQTTLDGASPPSSKEGPAVQLPFWVAPYEFAVHALVGSFIFALVAAPAVSLDMAIERLKVYKTNGVIVFGLEAAAYALFVTDVILFLVFVLRTALRVYRRL